MVSKYTLAVYCMHNLIGRLMIYLFEKIGLESGTLFMCMVVYVECYLIASIIAKIPIKMCDQLVE